MSITYCKKCLLRYENCECIDGCEEQIYGDYDLGIATCIKQLKSKRMNDAVKLLEELLK